MVLVLDLRRPYDGVPSQGFHLSRQLPVRDGVSFDTALIDLMPHTISVYSFASVNEYGEPTHSTAPTVYRALVQETPTLIGSPYGDETVASHVAYVASTSRIDLTSLITLPDGSQPSLIRSDIFADEDGTAHHVVLYFGVSK